MFRTFVAGVLSNDDNGTRRDFYYQDVADLKEALRVANERNATLEREKAALRKQLLVMPSASSVAGTGDPSAQRDAAAFMAETPPAHTFATSEGVPPELAAAGVDMRLINPGFVKTPLTDKNDFPMPFLIDVEEAVDGIIDGLQGDSFEIAFPLRFALLMKLMKLLPDRLFFAVTRRMLRK